VKHLAVRCEDPRQGAGLGADHRAEAYRGQPQRIDALRQQTGALAPAPLAEVVRRLNGRHRSDCRQEHRGQRPAQPGCDVRVTDLALGG